MTSESEVRNKAKEAGLNKQQEEAAVSIAQSNPNLSVDEAIQQAKNR